MMNRTRGFSLTETMLTLLLAGILFSSVFYIISISNRSSAGSYHLFLAEQLAREPVEILKSMRFSCVNRFMTEGKIADYMLNEWQRISPESESTRIKRSPDSAVFERHIILEKINGPDHKVGILAKIRVRPVASHRSAIALKEIVSSCIILQ